MLVAVPFGSRKMQGYVIELTDVCEYEEDKIKEILSIVKGGVLIESQMIALAGWMTSLSRNNLKRGGVYAAAAGAVFLATSIAGVDTPISFGIIYCMAACTLLYAATAPLLNRFPAAAGLISCLVLFAATYTLPHMTYPVEGLAWLGFPSASFVSGDYYPLLPNVFLYLAGAFAARCFDGLHTSGYPMWMMKANVPFLSMIGKLSLPIYLVHQPLLILIFTMVSNM